MSSDPGADHIIDTMADTSEAGGSMFGEEGEAVGGAFSGGLRVGQAIEHETGAGTAVGDFVFEHSNPDDAHAAAVHMDDAGEAWDQGSYGGAAVDAAEGLGSMVEGLWHGNPDSSSSADEDQ